MMVVQTYTTNTQIEIIEYTISLIFILEFFVKAIAIGFFIHKNSYLRDSWNILDFCIVLVSIIDFLLQDTNISFLKVIFMIRFYVFLEF